MSDLALQDDPTVSPEVMTELDLDWLSVGEDEETRWASTPHKYSVIPALIVRIPLSLVFTGIPLIVASTSNKKPPVLTESGETAKPIGKLVSE